MVLEARDITVKKYDKRALVLNGWIRIRIAAQYFTEPDYIKEGVSDYLLVSQEQVEKVISLNKKLRCNSLTFIPSAPIEFYSIKELTVDNDKYASYSKCSFISIKNLTLHNLSQAQIKEFLLIPKQIDSLTIKFSSLSNLDLFPFKFNKIEFSDLSFTGTVYLPSKLKELRVYRCKGLSFLVLSRVERLLLLSNEDKTESLFKIIQKAKGIKWVFIPKSLVEYSHPLPSTIRKVYLYGVSYSIPLESFEINKKRSFLIEIDGAIKIELAQILNLRKIRPILTETEEVFTCRPREIVVFSENIAELNKHPELFEKTERVEINCNGLNLDFLPEKMKKVKFDLRYKGVKSDLDSFRRNNWKFSEADIEIMHFKESDKVLQMLDSLEKARVVRLSKKLKFVAKHFAHLKFEFH